MFVEKKTILATRNRDQGGSIDPGGEEYN